jgi:arabinogalactan oligomer/maltooligosaccharide transport system substrate-binding protein
MKFRAGEIDLLIDGPWNLKDTQTALGDNVGLVLRPSGPSGAALPMNGIDGIFINPNSEHIAEAVEVALLMVSQENSQIFTNVGGHIPVRTDVSSTNPLINTFKLASATGFPRPQRAELTNYWMPFGKMINDVLVGTVDPTTGVMLACEEMNTLNGFSTYHVFLPVVKR